jgi:dTMP kinase
VSGRAGGAFITFEGPEGGGKSTQLSRLAEKIQATGLEVTTTREPGGTPAGERIRDVLLDPAGGELCPETEAFLFSAARTELVSTVIRPSLERGAMVLCDRFADATRAYQGFAGGLSLALIDELIELATGGLRPDLTLLFDLPVEQGLARRRADDAEWTRLDAATTQFHERVRSGYLTLAQQEPDRWVVINASASAGDVEAEVWTAVSSLIDGRSSSTADQERKP